MSREYTHKVIDLMNDRVISPTDLAEALAFWCSEQDMKEFYERLPDEYCAGSLALRRLLLNVVRER